MRHRHMAGLAVVVLVALGSVGAARADAAPPEPPPGASVETGEPYTMVQMVSESVLMVIQDHTEPPDGRWYGLASGMMVGHVHAYFKMVNQGTTAETLDVRFPLGSPDGYGEVQTVEDFTAYVDGEIVETRMVEEASQWDYMVPWAVWKTTFPPGQTVNLGVVYDVRPEGYAPYGTFEYILETGAGWYGSIGEGVVTFRLPYAVDALNYAGGTSIRGEPYMVSGTDVKWYFTDLEPTPNDNIHFTMLAPSVWREIDKAQSAADANPNSVDAQLGLAHALIEGLDFKYGLECCQDVADEVVTTYDRALELDPGNVEIYVEYLDFLLDLWFPYDPLSKPEQIDSVLERARALAPDDERLWRFQSDVTNLQQMSDEIQTERAPTTVSTLTSTTQPTYTLSPVLALTATPFSTPTPTPLPTPPPVDTPKIGVWVAIAAAVIGGAWVGVRAYRKNVKGAR